MRGFPLPVPFHIPKGVLYGLLIALLWYRAIRSNVETRTVYTPSIQSVSPSNRMFLTREDLTLPIGAKEIAREIRVTLDNRAAMQVRIVQGKRVLLRFFVETSTRQDGRVVYRRLRERGVTLSVGSVEEAERAIDAVLAFAMSLDGKHLAANEIANQQPISSESASETPST